MIDSDFESMLSGWASNASDIVALHLKQKLLPVEDSGIIFPPTYADIGYNIDALSDGTKVATIDSVGSQANRMEPIFKSSGKNENGEELNPLAKLVPQIEIELHTKGEGKEKRIERRSLLDLAHRSADAVVQASPSLAELMKPAFQALRDRGDVGPLCVLAPTSLVFGVWDSRGASGEKRPRLVRSVIRAWNVEPLFSAAQFNSVWRHLDESDQKGLKAALSKGGKLSEKGFADAPATFRKVSDAAARHMTEFKNGSPNPERRVLGGVIVRGEIIREVTINLVALRAIGGKLPGGDTDSSDAIRRYLLSLALLAATHDQDLFLREGCLLRYADNEQWTQVPRRGQAKEADLTSDEARLRLGSYANGAVAPFKKCWPADGKLSHKFSLTEAKKLLQKENADEAAKQ